MIRTCLTERCAQAQGVLSQSPLWSLVGQVIGAAVATGAKERLEPSPLEGCGKRGGGGGRGKEEGSRALCSLGLAGSSPQGPLMSLHGHVALMGEGGHGEGFGEVRSPAWCPFERLL